MVPVDVKARDVVSVLQDLKPDVAFNALHGKWGGWLRLGGARDLQIPYTHSGVLASSLACTRKIQDSVPRRRHSGPGESRLSISISPAAPAPDGLALCTETRGRGSSVGVHIVDQGSNGRRRSFSNSGLSMATRLWPSASYLAANITCAVIGDVRLASSTSSSQPASTITAPNMRRRLATHIARRYSEGCLPALPALCVAAHRALGCRGVTRADFRYDDTSGRTANSFLSRSTPSPA